MINAFRRLLIRIGKVLPFIMCGLVCITCLETLFACVIGDFIMYDGIFIPNIPISFIIGQFFEYNFQMLIVLCVISISVQTCIHNKLACIFLVCVLFEKIYFAGVELCPEYISIICIINIMICAFFVYKGISIIAQKG